MLALSIILLLNAALQARALKVPLDLDSSNHLYYAFLKARRIAFKHSYTPGVKIFLPWVYSILGCASRDPREFRIVNLLSSSLILILLFCSNPIGFESHFWLMFLTVILINSLWVSFTSSATEFHSPVIVMTALLTPAYFSPQYAWLIQLVLIAVGALGFKFINVLYIVPILAQHSTELRNRPLEFGLGVAALGAFAIWMALNTKLKSQSKRTSSGVSPKTLRYFRRSIVFIVVTIGLLLLAVFNSSPTYCTLLAVAVVIFLIQRSFVYYFFYPLIVYSCFALVSADSSSALTNSIFAIIALVLAAIHTVPKILLAGPERISANTRALIGIKDWERGLAARAEHVKYLANTIEDTARVYLWGCNVALMLLSKLEPPESCFYTHNHLVYWSNIQNPSQYLLDELKVKKPNYILVSQEMPGLEFRFSEFDGLYKLYEQRGPVKLYKLILKPSQ